MKRTALLLITTAVLAFPHCVTAASQSEVATAAKKAINILDKSDVAKNYPASAAADYFIMSASRMGTDYNYSSYISLTDTVNPTTRQDAHRLIMSASACGGRYPDSFVGMYTYDVDFESATELAGAIIALESGGYEVKRENYSLDNMMGKLLTMQQSNGSFANDTVATAKSIIAMTYRAGFEYNMNGTHDGEVYNYSVNSGINSAVEYLSSIQSDDGGYGTISATSYAVAALNAAGVNPDGDSRFTVNAATPVSYIISHQNDNGGFSDYAEDTAMGAFALTSHLRAMQGLSPFFDFISNDMPDTSPTENSTQTQTQDEDATQATQTSKPEATVKEKPTPAAVDIFPHATKAPEHSAVDAEEYGPFPFVGPIEQQNNNDRERPKSTSSVTTPNKQDKQGIGVGAVIAIIVGILALAGFAVITVIKFRTADTENENIKQESKSDNDKGAGSDLIEEIDKTHEVVSEEELYSPDFIKKLIPVDEIDTSIDSLIPPDDNDEKEINND